MIRFACPQCHKGFHVEDKVAGKKTKCPKCGAALTVPGPERSATPGPVPPLPAAKSILASTETSEVYGLASEPATTNQDDFWEDTLPAFSAHVSTPTPSRMAPIRSETIRLEHNSRTKRPSLALLGIGGALLIGITIGVTLWATGSLPSIKGLMPTGSGGSQEAARAHLASAIEKWMLSEKTEDAEEVVTLKTSNAAPPIGYEIRSILPTKPTGLNSVRFFNGRRHGGFTDEDPAFLANAVIEFKSEAGTPIKHAITYMLVWDIHEKKWYIHTTYADD